MINKKTKLFGTAFVACMCLSLVVMADANREKAFLATKADESAWVWEHYNEVAPTFTTTGSKEYWISCDDPTHTPRFTQPATGTINAAQDPAAGFAEGLATNDPRFLEKYRRALSFEEGMPTFITVSGPQTNLITSEQHTDGTKALQINLTGNGVLVSMNRGLISTLLGLPGAEVLLFDVKCLNTPDYTKPTLMYMRSASLPYNVRRFDDTHANKGVTVRGDNIRTYWKTFMITPEMFADLHADNEIMRFDNMSGNTVFIDNIRIGKNPAVHRDEIGFNGHSLHKGWTEGTRERWEMINLYKNYTEDSWNADLMLYSPKAITAEFTDAYTTDGGAALHVVTSDLLRIGITSSVYNSMGANDYVEFDYFVDPAGNDQHMYTVSWDTYIGNPNNYSNKGKWITFKITKSQLGTTSDLASSYYCICTASGPTNIYIDNVRVVRPAVTAIDFEYGIVSTFNTNNYAYTPNYNGMYYNTNLAQKNGTDIYYQGNFEVSLSDEQSKTGSRSLKAIATAAHSGLYISSELYATLPDAGITLDMYVTAAVNFNVQQGSLTLNHWNPGQWKTLTVPKANIKEWGSGYILFTYAGVTTSYIDNVRAAETGSPGGLNTGLVDGPSHDWYV